MCGHHGFLVLFDFSLLLLGDTTGERMMITNSPIKMIISLYGGILFIIILTLWTMSLISSSYLITYRVSKI